MSYVGTCIYTYIHSSFMYIFSYLAENYRASHLDGLNEEVITKTEAYFEEKDKSYYKSGIKMLGPCVIVVIKITHTYLLAHNI